MGTWGSGLYSGDFALDLRATVGAVLRLPLEAAELLDILRRSEPAAAGNPDDEDHPVFWLVVADRLTKKGVDCPEARDRALAIIDGSEDEAMLARLGMRPAELRKRRRMLEDLRARLVAGPVAGAARRVLKKPQPLLMEMGDVLIYPTCDGDSVNPYFSTRARQTVYRPGQGAVRWHANGWAALVILDAGRAFDYLAWYTPAVTAMAMAEKPSLASLRAPMTWRLGSPGTCSRSHFRKMELEKVGRLGLDPARVAAAFPGLRPGTSAAVGDVSIANSMGVSRTAALVMIPGPGGLRAVGRATIDGLGALLGS